VIPIIAYMTIDRFWELLSKKHCGEVSTGELNELEELLRVHPEWKKAAHLIRLKFSINSF